MSEQPKPGDSPPPGDPERDHLELTNEQRQLLLKGVRSLIDQAHLPGLARMPSMYSGFHEFKDRVLKECWKLPETRDTVAPTLDDNPHMKFLWEVQAMMETMVHPLRVSADKELQGLATIHLANLLGAQVEFMTNHDPLVCSGGCSHSGKDSDIDDQHGHLTLGGWYMHRLLLPLDFSPDVYKVMLSGLENQWQLRHLGSGLERTITRALTGRAARVIGSRGGLDPEDVAQSVWEGVISTRLFWDPFRILPRAGGADTEDRHLLRFMWNKVDDSVANYFRSAASTRRQPMSEEELANVAHIAPPIEEAIETLERQLAAADFPERARDALLKESRKLDYMEDLDAWLEGLSERAAAAKLGKPKSTVRYARVKIEKMLQKHGLEMPLTRGRLRNRRGTG